MIWWTKSWNPVIGCTKCSPACDNCYAEALHNQRHKALLAGKRMAACYSTPFAMVRFLPERLQEPLHWRKPQRIFVGNMGDLFHEGVKDEWLDLIFAAMAMCRQHTFMLLTKRPERMREYVQAGSHAWVVNSSDPHYREPVAWPLPNVWLGTTIWDQPSADRAVPILLETPAARRFVSIEPMLGPVDLGQWVERIDHCGACGAQNQPQVEDICPTCGSDAGLISTYGYAQAERYRTGERYSESSAGEEDLKGVPLDWVICGGETGANARPMHPDWPRRLRDQCQGASVPFFFKQWGEFKQKGGNHIVEYRGSDTTAIGWPDGTLAIGKEDEHGGLGFMLSRVGSRRAGRVLDGRTWEEVPHA